MRLFEYFKKNLLPPNTVEHPENAEVKTKEKPETQEPCIALAEENYYFDGVEEFTAYVLIHKNKEFNWITGNEYADRFKKAYALVEKKQYQEAIIVLEDSLKWNPVGLKARFEICECYIRQGNFFAAQNTLLEMHQYLLEKKNIASFYRRMGYIATEMQNYLCALACYSYSKKFENCEAVNGEKIYVLGRMNLLKGDISRIARMLGTKEDVQSIRKILDDAEERPEQILSQNRVPIIENK